MKLGLFFVILLVSSVSMAFAHSDPLNVMVKNQDGIVIYEKELVPPKMEPPKYIELFSKEWIYHNFIWVLASVIAIPVMITDVMIYKDKETKISKNMKNFNNK